MKMVLRPTSDSNINVELWMPTVNWNGPAGIGEPPVAERSAGAARRRLVRLIAV